MVEGLRHFAGVFGVSHQVSDGLGVDKHGIVNELVRVRHLHLCSNDPVVHSSIVDSSSPDGQGSATRERVVAAFFSTLLAPRNLLDLLQCGVNYLLGVLVF